MLLTDLRPSPKRQAYINDDTILYMTILSADDKTIANWLKLENAGITNLYEIDESGHGSISWKDSRFLWLRVVTLDH